MSMNSGLKAFKCNVDRHMPLRIPRLFGQHKQTWSRASSWHDERCCMKSFQSGNSWTLCLKCSAPKCAVWVLRGNMSSQGNCSVGKQKWLFMIKSPPAAQRLIQRARAEYFRRDANEFRIRSFSWTNSAIYELYGLRQCASLL